MQQCCRKSTKTLPTELKIKPLFDQSLFVRAAIQGVVPRSSDRGLSYGGDDLAVPGQLAQYVDYRHLDSAVDSGFGHLS